MQNEDSEVRTAHSNWLRSPITQAAFRAIHEHRSKFVEALERDATNKEITDEQIRCTAVGLKTCSAISMILMNSDSFKLSTHEQLTLK
jgi:hypothetical protein